MIQIDEDDRATVIFGDGVFGAIPPQGSLIRATYRVGGGEAGNVPAAAIATVVDAPQLALLGGTVTNPDPATGGAERESIEHAVAHAPAVFRSMRRAVTAADYEALALSFKGVGKVRAVATGWNEVTLFVAPSGGGKVSDVLEAGLRAYLEDKRMLTQLVEVSDVDYMPIRVTAEIAVQPFYVVTDVVARVRQAAADLLAFDHVDFSQTLYLSKFYEESQNLPGVLYVNITEFRREDSSDPAVEPTGKIVLGPNEVPVVPTDPAYANGMRVVVVNQAGV
jgi:predicted phage baseplate assembly protein